MPELKGDTMSGRYRYEYKEFTADDMRRAMNRLDLKDAAFARLWRVREPSRVAHWRTGKERIPPWVPVALAMMEAHPGNLVTLRQIAAETIVRDNWRPDDGEYPFLSGEPTDE